MRIIYALTARAITAVICFGIISILSYAQDAVPGELLGRTVMIKTDSNGGTGFYIDYHDRVYLITARHVLEGTPLKGATIHVYREDRWEDLHTVRTLYPKSQDADIGILELDQKISQPFQIRTLDENNGGTTYGQPVWFLGYPQEGLGSKFDGKLRFPFIKKGIISATDNSNPDAILYYVDGFNNHGFSGGPIICWDFSKHVYEIIGVVQGYRNDRAETIFNGKQVPTQLLVNSGILVGSSIKHVIDTLEQATR